MIGVGRGGASVPSESLPKRVSQRVQNMHTGKEHAHSGESWWDPSSLKFVLSHFERLGHLLRLSAYAMYSFSSRVNLRDLKHVKQEAAVASTGSERR